MVDILMKVHVMEWLVHKEVNMTYLYKLCVLIAVLYLSSSQASPPTLKGDIIVPNVLFGLVNSVNYNTDVDYDIGSPSPVKFNDVQIDVFQGQIGSESPMLIQNTRNAHVDAYYKDSNGLKYFSFDTDTSINGSSGDILKSDVIQCLNSSCSSYNFILDSIGAGLTHVNIDAFTVDPTNGDFIFSIDAAGIISGMDVLPADLIRFNDTTGNFSLEYDSITSPASGGIGADKNIDALVQLSNGSFLVSMADAGNYSNGLIGLFSYLNTDILMYTPSSHQWSFAYRPFTTSNNMQVNITSLMAALKDAMFKDSFEDVFM